MSNKASEYTSLMTITGEDGCTLTGTVKTNAPLSSFDWTEDTRPFVRKNGYEMRCHINLPYASSVQLGGLVDVDRSTLPKGATGEKTMAEPIKLWTDIIQKTSDAGTIWTPVILSNVGELGIASSLDDSGVGFTRQTRMTNFRNSLDRLCDKTNRDLGPLAQLLQDQRTKSDALGTWSTYALESAKRLAKASHLPNTVIEMEEKDAAALIEAKDRFFQPIHSATEGSSKGKDTAPPAYDPVHSRYLRLGRAVLE